MCSQPIEQDAHELRATPRSSCSSSAARPGRRRVAAVKLRVGSVETALNASRLARVPNSRYFAVAGPSSAPAGLSPRQHGHLVVDADLGGRPDQDGLEVLGPQDRAQPAAAGVAAVVADRGVADLPLPGRPDGRGLPAAPEPLPNDGLGLRRRQPGQLRRGFETGGPPSSPPSTRSTERSAARPRTTIASFPVSLPAIANRLDASASVSNPVSGDLATTANFALVVSEVPTSGENTNASGASGERVDAGRCQPVQQPGAQADPAEVGAQDVVAEEERRAHRRAVPDVHHQGRPKYPPAMQPQRRPVSRRRRPTGRRPCRRRRAGGGRRGSSDRR